MPADLRAHMRYPEDIFRVQTYQYALYHITDPVQYFNKQAIWDVAPSPDTSSAAAIAAAVQSGSNGGRNTTLSPTGSPIDPIYLTMALPDERGKASQQQFLLERSFTPRSKGGILSAFMFAGSDPNDYGKLMLYQVPNPTAPSPGQAASLIQSDQFISSQFTLLGTQGSRVIQGSVQLIPIGNAIVYVRPVWILGSGSATFPRYLAVAAALGSRAVLGDNMQDAIQALLTGGRTDFQRVGGVSSNPNATGSTTTTTVPGGGGPATTSPPASASVDTLLLAAQREFAAANAALRQGDLAGYQQHNAAAQADVNAAIAKSGGSAPAATTPATTTPTTKPPVTTTTGAP